MEAALRWQRNRMETQLSPPQIHQKIIWMLSNFHITTSEHCQRTPGIQKGSPFSLKGGRTKYQRRQWHSTPVLLPGKSHGQRSLAAVHEVAKSRTRLSDFTFTFHFHVLEKEMATHSSVLAWRIPGMGKPGGLPSMGSHRVGHDWSDLAARVAAGQNIKDKKRDKS